MGRRFPRRSVAWLFAVMCLVVGPVKRTMADDRPRNVTLFLSYPDSIKGDKYRVYFSHDGTAYVDFGFQEGIVIPPNLTSASAASQKFSGGKTFTATIAAEPDQFKISLRMDETDESIDFHELATYTLKIAHGACRILASNFKEWRVGNARPPFSTTTVGTPTCNVRPGRYMLKEGE